MTTQQSKHAVLSLLAGLSLIAISAGIGHAGSVPDRAAVEQGLRDTAAELSDLVRQNKASTCGGDIEIAADYVKAAALKLHCQRFDLSLVDSSYGHGELRDISLNRAWCRQVAAETLPFIVRTEALKHRIGLLSRIQE